MWNFFTAPFVPFLLPYVPFSSLLKVVVCYLFVSSLFFFPFENSCFALAKDMLNMATITQQQQQE